MARQKTKLTEMGLFTILSNCGLAHYASGRIVKTGRYFKLESYSYNYDMPERPLRQRLQDFKEQVAQFKNIQFATAQAQYAPEQITPCIILLDKCIN